MEANKSLSFPSAQEIYDAIKNGGFIPYGGNMRFVHSDGVLNVFIEKNLEYSGQFSIEEITEGVNLLKYYLGNQ